MAAPAPVHAGEARAVVALLSSDAALGLSSVEASRRLERDGPNRPTPETRPPYARLALDQLVDPLVGLLGAAAVVSAAIGDAGAAAVIVAIVVLNAVLGFWQALRAERAVRALSAAFTQTARVVRDGVERQVSAEEVVVGDVLLVAAGERVAADARVIDERGLDVDESTLTGESLPVEKHAAPVPGDAPVAERASMLFAGTGVVRGHGRALVSGTGARTEVGKIADLAHAAKPPPTPLERRLARLAAEFVVAGIGITILLAAAMFLRGADANEAFLVGVAVAVAAVPEGLAATVSAALALGARSIVARGAIVRRLDAVETLGETTVICTDKTGTLTENRIRVAALRPAAGVDEIELLRAAVLASVARAGGEGGPAGDPLEVALLLAAMDRGLSEEDLLGGRECVHEVPFDSERKRSLLVYADRDGNRDMFVKGAPEIVAELSREDEALLEAGAAWAEEGFRVLAVAMRRLDPGEDVRDAEQRLLLLGVVALHDPLRETARPAIDEAHRAGIEVRMLTGDHPATARTIGHALGLSPDAIVARATPADKLELVKALQARGEIVAVTGDGSNDAPALRRADVGVAMGRGGTEAAREAAAVVLTNDDFSTIVAAVREGRRIADNIRKFVAFLLSANLGEVVLFAVAIFAGLGAPLAVVQILLVNLVTDGMPAVALAQDVADAETMTSPPRTSQRILGGRVWLALGGIGLLVGGASLAAFALGRADGDATGQTMAFATLALSELALVFGIRSATTPAWRVPANRWLVASCAVSGAVVAGAIYLPIAQELFDTGALSAAHIVVVVALSLLPIAGIETAKAVIRRRGRRRGVTPIVSPPASTSRVLETSRAGR